MVISMSGDVVLLRRINVGKYGPMCLQRSLFIRLRTTGLLSACHGEECLAFKSPDVHI